MCVRSIDIDDVCSNKDLTQEVTRLVKDHKIANHRLEQIQQYQNLHRYIYGAKVIHQAKESLGLKGDFEVLKLLLSAVSTPVLIVS